MKTSHILSLLSALVLVSCSGAIRDTNQDLPSSQASETPTSAIPVVVANIQPGDTVASPLTIEGEALGTWYFEASFPIRLLDGNGQEIAVAPAQAQGDWMTTNYVPFSATLTFPAPVTATGTLVFEKDNPSGEPQNAASFTMQITF